LVAAFANLLSSVDEASRFAFFGPSKAGRFAYIRITRQFQKTFFFTSSGIKPGVLGYRYYSEIELLQQSHGTLGSSEILSLYLYEKTAKQGPYNVE
jgi:hypothetical protein